MGRRACRKAMKKPPFRKRGVGGIYTYTYLYLYFNLHFTRHHRQLAIRRERRWREAAGCFAPRANPPNPPFAKGGLFRGFPACIHSFILIPAPHRHSRESGNPLPRPIAAPNLAGVLDSGLRRNDGMAGGLAAGCWRWGCRGVDSRFRGNDGGRGGNDGGRGGKDGMRRVVRCGDLEWRCGMGWRRWGLEWAGWRR